MWCMAWFALSLIAAFTQATSDALVKRWFSDLDPFTMGTARLFYALPWLLPALFFIDVPPLDSAFYVSIACAIPVEILALVCYMEAVRSSPLSLVMPFAAFTPAFLTITGSVILSETPSPMVLLGIGLIVCGAYCLGLPDARKGVWEPFKAIASQKGPRLMLLVAFLYSVTSALGKRAILHSSPAFFGVTYFACLAIVMLGAALFITRSGLKRALLRPGPKAAVGMVYATMIFSHTAAIAMTQAAVMIALKRTSMIFGIVYGAVLFRETGAWKRLPGAILMLAGVVILGLWA